MEFKKLPVSKLTMNTGQIEGVPANPRQWTQADLDRLAASIEETPELLDARGAIVVPHKGKFVVLGVFSILIDKVSGKGTWGSNPWVYVYEFELVR